jgi:hypothetical protein
MIDRDDFIDCWFCLIGRAVSRYAEVRNSLLIRKTIDELQRAPAMGVYTIKPCGMNTVMKFKADLLWAHGNADSQRNLNA